MIPAGSVPSVLDALVPLLDPDDIVIDGGNSYYRDDMTRAAALRATDVHYVDVGTSGGVWGLERGFCLMIGGQTDVVRRLDPIFKTFAPGRASTRRPPAGLAGRAALRTGTCTAARPAPGTS
jgi:6-phosphogluconate dehydrogenase